MLALLPLLCALASPVPVQDPAPAPAEVPVVSASAWLYEFGQAQKLAKQTGRDLLVDFTGSDWCKYCKDLDLQVFRREGFIKAMAEDYVLVKVDVPRSPEALAKVPDIKRNRALAQQYRVQKWPTVLLMTSDGAVYARTGFKAGGVRPYTKHVQDLRDQYRGRHMEALEVIRGFEKGPPEHRALHAAQALELIPTLPPASALIPRLIPVVGHFVVTDPDNAKGDLLRALRVILPSGYASAEHLRSGRKLDPKNDLGLLELVLLAECYAAKNDREMRAVAKAILKLDALGPIKNTQAARVLYTNGALWTDRNLRDTAQAKGLARKALPYMQQNAQLLGQLRAILRKR